MAIGGPGGKRDDDFGIEDGGGFNEINITPLTDIFLVLLIIFMVTSSVIVNSSSGAKAGLKVNLPAGGAADVSPQASDLSVAILSDGRLVLGGDVVTADELKKAFDDAKAKSPDTMVIVQADEGVAHGKVVEVMEMAKGAGLGQLAIGVRDGQQK
ncbi:MAG: biopolymer transporter ExbD [Archangium sp.]